MDEERHLEISGLAKKNATLKGQIASAVEDFESLMTSFAKISQLIFKIFQTLYSDCQISCPKSFLSMCIFYYFLYIVYGISHGSTLLHISMTYYLLILCDTLILALIQISWIAMLTLILSIVFILCSLVSSLFADHKKGENKKHFVEHYKLKTFPIGGEQ